MMSTVGGFHDFLSGLFSITDVFSSLGRLPWFSHVLPPTSFIVHTLTKEQRRSLEWCRFTSQHRSVCLHGRCHAVSVQTLNQNQVTNLLVTFMVKLSYINVNYRIATPAREKWSFLQEFDCLRTLRLSLLLKSLKTWSHSLVPDLVYHHHICVSVALGFTPNVFPRENVWKYLPQIRFSKEPRARFTCFMSNVACFLASLFILTGHVSSWRKQTWCYIWVNCSKVCM